MVEVRAGLPCLEREKGESCQYLSKYRMSLRVYEAISYSGHLRVTEMGWYVPGDIDRGKDFLDFPSIICSGKFKSKAYKQNILILNQKCQSSSSEL